MALSHSTISTPLRDAIQSDYTILVNQLCAKDIREDLFAKEIIDMPLKQTIQNKSNSKEANEALVDHLYNSGTVGLVKRFIQVLRDTSSSYEVHEEIARILEGTLRAHNVVTDQSLPGQPEYGHRWYTEAIETHGSITVIIVRCVFTGSARVGKSSLKYLLLHNTARQDKTSTALLEAPELATFSEAAIDCNLTKGIIDGSIWKVVDDEVLGKLVSQAPISKRTDSFPSNALPIEKTKKTAPDQRSPQNSKGAQSVQTFDSLLELEEARKQFLQKYNISTEAEFNLESCPLIYLLDTGGQPSFQHVIPLLLDFPCNFLHIFKASEKLTNSYKNVYCCDGITERRKANSRTSWEVMKQSLTAAFSMSMKSCHELKAFDQSVEPKLHVLLVGSHLSHLPKEPEAKRALLDHNEKIIRELKGRPYAGNIVPVDREVRYEGIARYFLVDSDLQGREESIHTHKIADHIRSMLSAKEFQLTMNVPKVWFCLQLITSSVRKKMWKYTELRQFCIQSKYIQLAHADGQLHALVTLFHSLGVYVYFDLPGVSREEQWICTDATFLYKEISKVLTVQYSEEDFCGFKETGEVLESQCEKLFKQHKVSDDIPARWLLDILVHVGIAAKVIQNEKIHYFIPAVLSENDLALPNGSLATLGFTFAFHSQLMSQLDTHCMPTGIFHRLAVDITSRETKALGQGITKPWTYIANQSDSTRFMFSQEASRILLTLEEDIITLHLLVPEYFPKLDLTLSELCKLIREEMCERISYISQQVFGSELLSQKATLKTGVICRRKDCKDANMHLLEFVGDNQITGICTRSGIYDSMSSRESLWNYKKPDPLLDKLTSTSFEFANAHYLCYEETSVPIKRHSSIAASDSRHDSIQKRVAISNIQIQEVADSEAVYKWRGVCRRLGVSDDVIAHSVATYITGGGGGPSEAFYQAMKSWRDEKGDEATLSVLTEALKKSGYYKSC